MVGAYESTELPMGFATLLNFYLIVLNDHHHRSSDSFANGKIEVSRGINWWEETEMGNSVIWLFVVSLTPPPTRHSRTSEITAETIEKNISSSSSKVNGFCSTWLVDWSLPSDSVLRPLLKRGSFERNLTYYPKFVYDIGAMKLERHLGTKFLFETSFLSDPKSGRLPKVNL